MAHPLPETPTQILRLRWQVPAEEVGEADGDAGPEQRVAREGALRVVGAALGFVDLPLQDDGHDDSVDGHGLAEDNAES